MATLDVQKKKEPDMSSFKTKLALGLGASVLPGLAMAAGTATGVEAGFFALGTDLNTILSGAGGFVLLLISVIIGGATWAFTGRASAAAGAVGVALFLGYGIQILSSLSGTTATIDMVAMADLNPSGITAVEYGNELTGPQM